MTSRFLCLLALVCCLLQAIWAQQNEAKTSLPPHPIRTATSPAPVNSSKITLETSETLFSLLAALNACGYDEELSSSDPIRAQIRAEVAKNLAASEGAGESKDNLCRFYKDHQQQEPGHDMAQYISLGLYLNGPPAFSTVIRESDLPPDASYVLGIIPLLQTFYQVAGLHDVWQRHHAEYENMVERFHEPVANMILRTDLYLKIQFSSYLGRRFELYIEPMGAPGEINARNYGEDYFLVISPSRSKLKMDEVRHTYLHYVLDPYTLKRGTSLKRLEPILLSISTAPMDESFKNDAGLLVTESLIRAIEARTMEVKGKDADETRLQSVQDSINEGFVLTRYFYDALIKFEKDPAGLKDTYSDWLYGIDVAKEKKRAESLTFSPRAAPEVLRASKQRQASLLDLAEQRMAAHDFAGALKLARQALDQQSEDPARALFILARAASQNGDMPGARTYFERTLEVAREPRMVAWSHIYLGRIFDLQDNRDAALNQYRAALAAGDTTPDTKVAAERGLAAPYEPPVSRP